MKKVLIGLGILTAICVIHVFLLFKKGYQPPKAKVMTPSAFNSASEIGSALARHYWKDLREEAAVAMVTDARIKSGGEIASAFLKEAQELGLGEKVIIASAESENSPATVVLIQAPFVDYEAAHPYRRKKQFSESSWVVAVEKEGSKHMLYVREPEGGAR